MTTTATTLNADYATAEFIARAIIDAYDAGFDVVVNGHKVKTTFRHVATVYMNGTIEIMVESKQPGVQGSIFVKKGQSVTMAQTEVFA